MLLLVITKQTNNEAIRRMPNWPLCPELTNYRIASGTG